MKNKPILYVSLAIKAIWQRVLLDSVYGYVCQIIIELEYLKN